ncbi:hypothetical protein DFR49_0409 [Hephaestia caeni]|uniref:Uncharacterized protein n=1 Tax=Hephaestia caeni TaxID=645617 RepID=A0A397PJK6_9SPHN|nr:hypothetical protein [Hephaestia caeni]RIA45881.1 hypothetical protein DFR49_0409 [Hephaestia caeni]
MRIVLLTAGLCLAACQQAPQNASDAQTTQAAGNMEFTEVPPDESVAVGADGSSSRDDLAPAGSDAAATPPPATAAGSLPPADAAYRYVGRWAATRQLCATGAWRFHERRLDTAGEVSCTFDKIEKAPGGYDIAATCLAEGNRTGDTIELRFAESARAMLVSSKMWDGIGLSYCGPVE